MEIAVKEERPLLFAFLDISQAYDSIEQDRLWQILQALDMPEEWRNLLQRLYADAEAVVQWGNLITPRIQVSRGLRQGCPMSPLLFMLYVAGMERKLSESGLGFNLNYLEEGFQRVRRLPALFYADDIVLLADNAAEMQALLDICAREGTDLGLNFSARKSAAMRFTPWEAVRDPTLLLQGKEIEWADRYKYLGVTVTATMNYICGYEKELRAKALKRRAFLGSRALWAFSRYEVTRELWKGVAVPALTFGNAVVCLSSATRQALEVRQREAGRTALGVHAFTPNEAVQGDLGWSSFEAREAVAKLSYERRLSGLPDGRWAREVYKYVHLRSVRTKWVARTRSLSERYRVEAIRLTAPLQRDTRKKVRESVSAVETERWRESGRAKRALALYWEAKTDIAKEALYDNSRGSGLLCEARSGVLRTRSLRARYTAELDTMCPLCQGAEETIRHIVLECTGLRPAIHDAQDSGTSAQGATGATNDSSALARALGFRGSGELPSWEAVEATKRRLECWWRKQVEQTRAPRR
ncbi:retrovirus-related Pol polyprotein from type-2 retrotransposable element R2DM [Rhipicephalus sanguineus]|uniref:retrovirus-related Pol polyprotein from type-2 retrotransposable element R2DM n=1 Tax=Rhipicephalus sanguineus TaxID=34632 RepID=UPI0020C58CF5|nr:retrovirus-related Pol polyprotein from type-2 retrotransposable element R2DM [Rhipicephalus sanguineus]